MGLLFTSDFHDGFGTWPLAYIPSGGADFGEVLAVARSVGDGDDEAFFAAWLNAADRQAAAGEAALSQGHRQSARDFFLKASCFYASAYHPLYGKPVDPRLVAAFRKQGEALDRGLALSDPPVQQLRIPFEGSTLPAYLIPALGRAKETRPLVIQTNGYDASITDMYFASAVAVSRRGYHCLLFDGPGQGEMLIEHGIPLRPDWETVVRPVVDFALNLPTVDPARVALSGWSLGGYLAPRAASGEHRLAACIADPGQWNIADSLRRVAVMLGATPEAASNLGGLDQAVLDQVWALVSGDRNLRWRVVQRGFWANGVDNLRDFLRCIESFTLEGRAELIRCPTLLTAAENDTLALSTPRLFEALRCPKELLQFTSAEGAGDHCEMMNRSLLNGRALDWLDSVLGQTPRERPRGSPSDGHTPPGELQGKAPPMKPSDYAKAAGAAALLLVVDVLIAIGVVYLYGTFLEPGHPAAYYAGAAIPVARWSTRIAGTALMFAAAWFFGKRRPDRNASVFAIALAAFYGFWDGASAGFVDVFTASFAFTIGLKLVAALAGASVAARRRPSLAAARK